MCDVKVKIFPASYGDCFLVSFENNKEKFNILIDGGLVDTYKRSLKKELKSLGKNGEKINLLINTHIDSDHINGLIAFLRENNKKQYIEIEEIWYNGLEQIASKYINQGEPNSNDAIIIDKICEKGYEDEFKELEEVSSTDGISLSSLIEYGNYNLNTISNGKAITSDLNKVCISENVQIKILSPCRYQLDELEEEWLEELAKLDFKFSIPKSTKLVSSFEFLVSRLKSYYEIHREDISDSDNLESYLSDLKKEDSSIVNNSSLSFVLEVMDKKLLFLGDAVIRNKETCNIIKSLTEEYGINQCFSLIKLPHHGSSYNITTDFLDRFKANEYIISTNSEKFDHPDIDVLANVILRNQSKKTLIFNDPVKECNLLNDKDWKKKYNYNIIYGDGEEILERRY